MLPDISLWTKIIDSLLTAVSAGIAVYFTTRIKNIAFSQDVAKITSSVESVKQHFTLALEKAKAELSKDIHASNLLRAKEIELCHVLWSDLVDLEYALEKIRTTLKFDSEGPDSGTLLKDRLEEWQEALTKLHYGYEKARPFLSTKIYQEFNACSSSQLLTVGNYVVQIKRREHVVPNYKSFIMQMESDWLKLDEIFERLGAELQERFKQLSQ